MAAPWHNSNASKFGETFPPPILHDFSDELHPRFELHNSRNIRDKRYFKRGAFERILKSTDPGRICTFFLPCAILLAHPLVGIAPPQIVPSAAISSPHYLHSLEITLFLRFHLPPLQKVRNAAIFAAREPFSTAFPINGAHLFSPTALSSLSSPFSILRY